MSRINLIAAIDQASGLGNKNQLLCYLPADLQHFKKITMGHPIIMGRKTYESIGKPLPGRINIVLSQSISSIEGVRVVNSLEKALDLTQEYPEVFIIGGSKLFTQAIQIADRLFVTRIHHQFEADVFFPEIDQELWNCLEEQFQQQDEKNSYDMTFCFYERRPIKNT